MGPGLTNRVVFGSQLNRVETDRMDVGYRKAIGYVTATAGGTIEIASASGNGANLHVGFNEAGTGTISEGVFDARGATLNADFDFLRVGRHNNGSGAGRGSFYMDGGAVTVRSNVQIAQVNVGGASSNPKNTTGLVELTGGSLNVVGNILQLGGAGALNIFGGHVSAANVQNLDQLSLTGGSLVADQITGTGNLVMSGGRLTTGLVNTDLLVTGGVVAPALGQSTVAANHSLMNAMWELEIDGATNDAVAVTGALTLDAGSMLFITNVNDTVNEAIVLGSYSNLTGTFSSTNTLPDGWALDYNYLGGNQIALVQLPSAITNVVTAPGCCCGRNHVGYYR